MPLVRIGLVTEGGYPYAAGETGLWCDRLVRGLPRHEFELYALSRSAGQEARGRVPSRGTSPGCGPPRPGPPATTGARTRDANGGASPPASRTWSAGSARTGPKPPDPSPPGSTNWPPSPANRAGCTRPCAPKRPYGPWRPAAAPRARAAAWRRPGSPTCWSSSMPWNGCCGRCPSTGTRTTDSVPSTSATPRPAGSRRSPDSWPNASSGSRCWSPSTGSRCAPTTWSTAGTTGPPCAHCSRPSRAGSPARSTPAPTSSPPATRTPAAGRSAAGPRGSGCGPCTRGWRRTDSPPSARTRTAATPTPWCGSAAWNPPRT